MDAGVLSLLSTGFSVVSAISDARAARDQANYQADVAAWQANYQATINEQQAARERQVAASDEEDYRRQQRRILAQSVAATGGSGVSSATGTPLLTELDFLNEVELNAMRIRNAGDVRGGRLDQQAGLTRTVGSTNESLLRQSGRNAMTSGFARGGAALFGYASNNYGTKKTPTTSYGYVNDELFYSPSSMPDALRIPR